jgi:hypothetical protein
VVLSVVSTQEPRLSVEALVAEAYESAEKLQEPSYVSDIRDRIRFRLMGYDIDGTPVSWAKDVQQVLRVEQKLVIDPSELRDTFARIRSAGTEQEKDKLRKESSFEKYGRHVELNIDQTLYRVRREGWVILAGIVGDNDEFKTIGYNYGLDSMPSIDNEFMFLDLDTLSIPENEKRQIDLSRISINWRTGIAEQIDVASLRKLGVQVPDGVDNVSLRRIGIASALKYIITNLAESRKKEQIMFNIATLFDFYSKEKLRNGPSFHHNRRIFEEDFTYRKRPSQIVIKGSRGEREFIAQAQWRARGDLVRNALHNLERDDSKLKTDKWALPKIFNDLHAINEQIEFEVEDKTHKPVN